MATIPCICPPTDGEKRHPDGDRVEFKARLGLTEGRAVRLLATDGIDTDDPAARGALVLAKLVEGYLLFGIESWTLVDESGKPIPVSHTNIRRLVIDNDAVAEPLGDVADDLYGEAVILPLLVRASKSQPDTQTPSTPNPQPESTSPPTDSLTPLRRPSKRSSTTTTPTGAIGTTTSSPAGGSNSSQSSASAA